MRSLAMRMAGSIQKSRQKKVLVFDFMGPGTESERVVPDAKGKMVAPGQQSPVVTALGVTLAGDF